MAWTAASLFPQFNQVALPQRTQATDVGSVAPVGGGRTTQTGSQAAGAGRTTVSAKTGSAGPGARKTMMDQVLNDPSLMGTGRLPVPAGATQVGSSIPVTGPSVIPPFLRDPAGVLNNALNPYQDLLSRIMQPQGSSMPPEVAAAYANAANAAAARTQAQTRAIQSSLALPGQAANLGQRLSTFPNSLAGLPTSLGYRDPAQALRDQIFQTNAMMLPNSGVNQLARASAGGSGWFAPPPGF